MNDHADTTRRRKPCGTAKTPAEMPRGGRLMQTIADVPSVVAALDGVTISDPIVHGALVVFPLLDGQWADPDWATIDDAGPGITIDEVSEHGSVRDLRVRNDTDRAVLLIDGEELIGAKQNRVLNTTVLVAARSTVTIPVSCVEQGRWAYRGKRFVSGDASLYASLRAKKAAQVSRSLRARAGHQSDQGEIWRELQRTANAYRVKSPTGAMHDVFAEYEGRLTAAREALAPVPRQVGAIVYLSGKWLGLEIFASEPCSLAGGSGSVAAMPPMRSMRLRLPTCRAAPTRFSPLSGVHVSSRLPQSALAKSTGSWTTTSRVPRWPWMTASRISWRRGRVATRGRGPDS
jgi:hypothetical protein